MDKSKDPVLFAADCAEQVLPIFESAYPTDDRPRKAIEAARSGASVPAARAAASAAHAAARDATDIAAVYAARAAGHAAATIHVAAHAPRAAAYAAKAALEVTSRGTRWLSQPHNARDRRAGYAPAVGHTSGGARMPGSNRHHRLDWAFVFGFDRLPSRQEVEEIAACDPDLSDVTVSTGMLPGPPPEPGHGLEALAFTMARAHGRDKLHREIDLAKVAFQVVHGFLVIRIRQ